MINNKKVLKIAILGGISIALIVGRLIYLNYAMNKEAENKFTPEVEDEVTNGNN
jgi:hypothetical protein